MVEVCLRGYGDTYNRRKAPSVDRGSAITLDNYEDGARGTFAQLAQGGGSIHDQLDGVR